MKKKITAMKIIKGIGIAVLICVLLFLLLLAFLTITEYRPKQKISLRVNGTASQQSVTRGEHLSLATWNVGYGALGDNADFFMDGGSHVKTASKARVQQNIKGQKEALQGMNPDFVFLQEVDRNSSRSYHINEAKSIASAFPEDQNTFAQNFRVAFIPYPVPPIGKVDGGIVTLSDRTVQSSTRIQLPCPFKWPVRLGMVLRYLVCREPRTKMMLCQPQISPAMLGRIQVPTLVLCGAHDMIRPADSRAIAAAIPGARLVILPGNHFIANQAPAAFNQAVRAFLEEPV